KIALSLLPFVLYVILHKRYSLPKKKSSLKGISFKLSLACLQLFAIFVLYSGTWKTLLYMQSDVTATMKTFGLNTGSIVDISEMLFGAPSEEIDNPYDKPDDPQGEVKKLDTLKTGPLIDNINRMIVEGHLDGGNSGRTVYTYNTLNIDWDKLIAEAPNATIRDMHKYFASVPASNKNDYTGMFEGKNLIFLTLEGFSYKALSPEKTPMLWRMYTEGFYFTNFYDSLWGGSTATGEYCNMTGNMYTTANCLAKSEGKLNYSAFGNLFKSAGYTTLAYHNHTYTYYSRDVSHPAYGYKYKAIGNGLKLAHSYWPNSDYEMAVATAPEFVNLEEPFHVYYMTVSGHANYNWGGNAMCRKHKDEVMDLYSKYDTDGAVAYIAGELEVEYMIQHLVQQLEAAGKLEDTVFAMCCDHYPYALTDEEAADLYKLSERGIRGNLELYHNAFILWCSSMEEPVVIDKPCSALDMVPTIANLFGLDYESKVITGTDILSDNEIICIINTSSVFWNWRTEQGTYYNGSGTFTPSPTCTMTKAEINDYVNKINNKLKAMRKYSMDILNYDYYKYVFNKDFTPKYTK
ncbi:MAG: LTA synthase family protein, partial [Erysipelotrichaceae bacterium]|nr:LTA synthase family protein [Erysipelotrichaceae bacterium]